MCQHLPLHIGLEPADIGEVPEASCIGKSEEVRPLVNQQT
jgi:hypothetical protein